jgi:hypothetical protein
MARRTDTVEEVDTPDAETEEVTAPTEAASNGESKPAKAAKEPARGDLPDGFVTPVGLAKKLSEPKDGNKENDDASNWYHTDKNGSHEVKPQMVYSYKNNATKEDPFPIQTIKDSLSKDRDVVKLDEGLAWWDRKNERVQGRKANAAAKVAAKAEKASKSTTEEAEGSDVEETVATEAE